MITVVNKIYRNADKSLILNSETSSAPKQHDRHQVGTPDTNREEVVKKAVKAMVAGMTVLSVGCAKAPGDGGVLTSLTMTGSGQATTIASYKFSNPLLNLIMPSAIAMPAPAMVDAAGANVTLTKAWIVVKEVEFKVAEVGDAAEAAEVELQGPYYVDLLSSTPTSFGEASVPAGVYRRIKMKLESAGALPASAPSQLQNKSIYLEGTVAGNQISYSSHDGTEFKISGAGGVNIAESSNMLVAIKMADLFKMIDFTGIGAVAISEDNRVNTGTSRCPLIDSTAADLYKCFRVGLEKAGKFGKDSDGNHEIEAGEDEVHD